MKTVRHINSSLEQLRTKDGRIATREQMYGDRWLEIEFFGLDDDREDGWFVEYRYNFFTKRWELQEHSTDYYPAKICEAISALTDAFLTKLYAAGIGCEIEVED